MNYPLTVIKAAWRRIRRPRRITVQMLLDRPSPEIQLLYQDLIIDMEKQVGIPGACCSVVVDNITARHVESQPQP